MSRRFEEQGMLTRTASANPLRPHSTGRPWAVASIGLVVALTAGCKQPTLCEALGDCGGALPSGDYALVKDMGTFSCSEDLYAPPPDTRLKQADIPSARTPLVEPALFDWCQLIGTGQGTDIIRSKPPGMFPESAPIGGAILHYSADGTYVLSTTRTGTFDLDLPAYCMRAFGATDMGGMNLCQRLEMSLNMNSAAKYRNFHCVINTNDPASNYGCFCTYDFVEVQKSAGRFIPQSASEILHLPGNDFPETVTYCNAGARLQLTGTDGEYLFDRVGLRTLDLVKITANCTDGVQGPGEEGVDCGFADGCMPCPP
jgi:hypothetical protein